MARFIEWLMIIAGVILVIAGLANDILWMIIVGAILLIINGIVLWISYRSDDSGGSGGDSGGFLDGIIG